jgi:hypothetical protein
MSSLGVYLYCFTRSGAGRQIKAAGVDGHGTVTALDTGRAAAVFSTVRLDEFGGEAVASKAQDPQWLIPRACEHERVIEEVMQTAPALPVRFGTIFSSSEALERFLAKQGPALARILDRLSDKEEWAVKGFVDLALLKEWLRVADPVLAEGRRRLPESPGAHYFRQKRLDAQVEEAVKFWSCGAADLVRASLASFASDARPLRLQARSVTGRGAEMIFNMAYLLLRDDIDRFRDRVSAAGAAYTEQGLTLELSGPWPPYNFCPPLPEGQDEALGVLRSA